jgi:demethylmacrocin O-methyltransferase
MDAGNMKTLDDLDTIAIRCQTDRASVFTRTYAKPHGYAAHYDKLFSHLRHEPVKLLEIGAAGGEGIRMWMEYFDNARTKIFGVDIVKDTNEFNTPGLAPGHFGRYYFNCGDQSSPTFWACWLSDHGGDLDIVIDDGGHFNDGIITSFRSLWPAVRPGGFYAVEDLGCSYSGSSIFVKPGWPLHMDWVQAHVDAMNTTNGDIDSIYLSKELAVFKKKTTT